MKHIILIRHSQAEDLLEGMEDATRSLTEKGKKKLRKISPFLNRGFVSMRRFQFSAQS